MKWQLYGEFTNLEPNKKHFLLLLSLIYWFTTHYFPLYLFAKTQILKNNDLQTK